jgi:hypothetical protein
MKARIAVLSVLLLVAAAATLSAHDMFIKLDKYFLVPGDTIRVPILNGTFTTSENGIEWERVRALIVLDSSGITHPGPRQWIITKEKTTTFELVPQTEGTYVVGVATKPRELSMTGKEFNEYLKEEGITDILALRKKEGELGKGARERYAKNVKAVFQVGEKRTPSVATPFGFDAEIIPLDNPYIGQRTGRLRFRCLVDGKPVAGMTVLYGSQKGSAKPRESSLVTDKEGIVSVKISRSGKWYVKFVRMVPVRGGDVDYESKWATITFEAR